LIAIDCLKVFGFIAEVSNDLCGFGAIFVHSLLKNLFRIVASLLQRRAINIANSFSLWRLRVNIVDMFADRTHTPPCDPA
jgi:hypothetical protein